MPETNFDLVGLAADIVAAYVVNNRVSTRELPSLIASVHASLSKIGGEPEAPAAVPVVPAVSIRKSVTAKAIICLEDGKSFKSMKGHLSTKFGMTPAEYRTKWGLPADYPMVAPAYAAERSALAKSMGLGKQRKKSVRPDKR